MSNDGNVSFTPIHFPFSPFQKKTLSFTTIVLLFISLLVFLHNLCRREFPLFCKMFFFSFLIFCLFLFSYFLTVDCWCFYFSPSFFAFSFYFFLPGASEVAGIRFFLYIIGISIPPPPSTTSLSNSSRNTGSRVSARWIGKGKKCPMTDRRDAFFL